VIGALLSILLALALGAPGTHARLQGALVIPENDGWVTDLGDMLGAEEERALEALMESYKAGSGHEVALLTVADLRGRTIEELGLETARAWGIGDREDSAGALLVAARDERKLRIEVGRGLEGQLPDVIAARIIRDVIGPGIRAGGAYAGLRAGVEAIHAALGGDYGPVERAPGTGGGGQALASLLAFVVMVIVLSIMNRGGRGGRGRRAGLPGGILPWIIASQLGHRRSGGSFGSFGGGGGGGGFSGFGGGGGFSGGGASGGW
jgi:uncharacterized protein